MNLWPFYRRQGPHRDCVTFPLAVASQCLSVVPHTAAAPLKGAVCFKIMSQRKVASPEVAWHFRSANVSRTKGNLGECVTRKKDDKGGFDASERANIFYGVIILKACSPLRGLTQTACKDYQWRLTPHSIDAIVTTAMNASGRYYWLLLGCEGQYLVCSKYRA